MSKSFQTLATLAGLLAIVNAAQAAPIISPFAADLSAGAYSADRALGGSAQSAFNGGYWNAGTYGFHWIQADMGEERTLSEVRFAIDVTPSAYTYQNIYLSDVSVWTPGAHLNLVAQRSGGTTKFQEFTLDFAPATGRYLVIESHGGASWTAIGDGSPRTDWVDPAGGGTGGHVPEPGSLALAMGALAAVSLRRRAGKSLGPAA